MKNNIINKIMCAVLSCAGLSFAPDGCLSDIPAALYNVFSEPGQLHEGERIQQRHMNNVWFVLSFVATRNIRLSLLEHEKARVDEFYRSLIIRHYPLVEAYEKSGSIRSIYVRLTKSGLLREQFKSFEQKLNEDNRDMENRAFRHREYFQGMPLSGESYYRTIIANFHQSVVPEPQHEDWLDYCQAIRLFMQAHIGVVPFSKMLEIYNEEVANIRNLTRN